MGIPRDQVYQVHKREVSKGYTLMVYRLYIEGKRRFFIYFEKPFVYGKIKTSYIDSLKDGQGNKISFSSKKSAIDYINEY